MARGWESKSVEQQQAEIVEQKTNRPHLTPAQKELNRKREGLILTRKRLSQQLEAATHPQHREMLAQSIAVIDQQLASFEQPTSPPGT